MNKPISLEAVRSEPLSDLIACLESLLKRAKSGELRSIVYLGFEGGGVFESGNSGDRLGRAYVLGAFQQAGLDYYHRRRNQD